MIGWKQDSQISALGDFASELSEKTGFIPYKYRIRPYIAQKNVLANNALWDGNFDLAISLLLKHGLGDRRNVSKPNESSRRRLLAKNRIETRLSTDRRKRSGRSAWNVCK